MSQKVDNGFVVVIIVIVVAIVVVVVVVVSFASHCILFYPSSIDPTFQIFVHHLRLPSHVPTLHIIPIPSLALINRAGILYRRILTGFVSTDRMQ